MKKIFLLSFIFIFSLSLVACTNVNQETEKQSVNEASKDTNTETKKELIKTTNNSTSISDIKDGDVVNTPLTITGKTDAGKNKLFVELRDKEHASKVRGYAIIAENEDAQNDFKITLNFVFNSTKEGFIAVYELDNDGQEKNLTEIPIKYNTEE